ncbi:fatty acid 2-hydroxylase [Xylocopa sonorina]|uniref:fatty acid 2-hydroxylase n=1 Tax=Xylocopa sonorina TaxID=1818115 RepID=UPI00403AB048
MANDQNSGSEARKRTGQLQSEEESAKNEENNFVVTYKDKSYNVREFLQYHPGGKVLSYYKNRSLDKAFEENPHSLAAFHLLEDYTLNNLEKYQKYEELLDWDAPILGQVGTLGDKYYEWVNLPVDRRVRLFHSNLLESLSLTPWYLIPMVWIPVCLLFLYSGWTHSIGTNYTLIEASISYALGIFLWTILEYILHRKIFHFEAPPNAKLLMSLHFLMHGLHHKTPFDNKRLVFPPIVGLLVAQLIWYIYGLIFPEPMLYFIAAGTTTGYIGYDLIHYYLHYGTPNAETYFYFLKRNHNYHHFSHHDIGFGVTSKLWDHVFGTLIRLRKLAKPIQW